METTVPSVTMASPSGATPAAKPATLYQQVHTLANPHALTAPADYNIMRTIRQSIYGKVRLGQLKSRPDVIVALKISSLAHVRARSTLEDPEQETFIMRHLSANGGHPNVLKLYDDFVQVETATVVPKYHWQILEYCSQGELFDLIDATKGKSGIGEDVSRRFFQQLVRGLKFIHTRGVAHLDISPENVLIDDSHTPKIIDFGMARALPPNGIFPGFTTHKPGKLAYMAPEVYAGLPFSGKAADVFSLGVVLFTMLVGFPPYAQPSSTDKRFEMIYTGQLAQIMHLWGLSSKISPAAIDLLQSMLNPPPKRATLDQIEAHPWFNNMDLTTRFNIPPALSTAFDLSHLTSVPADAPFSLPVSHQVYDFTATDSQLTHDESECPEYPTLRADVVAAMSPATVRRRFAVA